MQWSVSCDVADREPLRPMGAEAAALLAPLGTETWCTASGRRIRHTVYSLIGCPPIGAATYLLIRRAADGRRVILAIRRTRSNFPSLNLAHIRRIGARLGANEVHLFHGLPTDEGRRDLVADLSRALHPKRHNRA